MTETPNHRPRLTLFDLDHTLLPLDSDYEWGEFTIRIGWTDPVDFARRNAEFYAHYQAGTLDVHDYVRFATEAVRQRGPEQARAAHERFMREVIAPAIRPEALQLVRQHQQAGDRVLIVTATNEFVTRPIAQALGVQELLAMQLARDASGWYTGAIQGTPTMREGKVQRMEEWLSAHGLRWADVESTLYSDSMNDGPLLEQAVAAATRIREYTAVNSKYIPPIIERKFRCDKGTAAFGGLNDQRAAAKAADDTVAGWEKGWQGRRSGRIFRKHNACFRNLIQQAPILRRVYDIRPTAQNRHGPAASLQCAAMGLRINAPGRTAHNGDTGLGNSLSQQFGRATAIRAAAARPHNSQPLLIRTQRSPIKQHGRRTEALPEQWRIPILPKAAYRNSFGTAGVGKLRREIWPLPTRLKERGQCPWLQCPRMKQFLRGKPPGHPCRTKLLPQLRQLR